MKWCVLIYKGKTDLGEYERTMGVYHFQEIPHVGDTIEIYGSGRYKVKEVVHEFIKASAYEDIAKENKVIVYVK